MEREEEIIRRLNANDTTLKEILMLIKGSQNLGVEGIMPSMRRVDSSLKVLTDWKNEIMSSKGKLDIKEAGKWIAFISAVMGILSGVASAVFFGVKKIFELIH